MMPWLEKIGKYKIINEIGSGGFGTVYLAEYEGTKYALKQLEKGFLEPEIAERFTLESKKSQVLRKKYNLSYIIQVIEILYEHNAYVMEYIPESSEEYFKKGADDAFIIYLIRAFTQLHSLDIIHRDIKPTNIRVKNSQPVIIDFGATSWWDGKSYMPLIGTKYYSPPEMVVNFSAEYYNLEAARNASLELNEIKTERLDERLKYIKKLHDVYSLGITLGKLLTTEFPFNPDSYIVYLRNGGSKDFEIWLNKIPVEFRAFIEKATTFSPMDRPQLDNLLKLLDLTPFEFIYDDTHEKEDTDHMEGDFKCLKCSEEKLPGTHCCPVCHEKAGTIMLHIEPEQDIKIKDSPVGVQLIPGVEDAKVSIAIDLDVAGFEITLGRDPGRCHISFPDDLSMSRVHGRLIKEKDQVYYIDGKDGKFPKKPGRFKNFPVGDSRVRLLSGSSLLLGSTVFKIYKYFGKLK